MAETAVAPTASGERRLRVSYEEFRDWPGDVHAEWADGEMIIFPPPQTMHQSDKFYEYQAGGVREYWIIDPRPGKQRVDCSWLTPQGQYQATLPDADGRYHAATLPGLWFHPDWLWQEPLPNPLLALAEVAPQALRAALAGKLGLS